MGHRLSASEEVQQLRQATREAHEAAQDLRAAIREAKALEPGLVTRFEEIHAREIKGLSNYFTEEANRHAAQLNEDVTHARQMIIDQMMAGEIVLSADKREVSLKFGAGRFADNDPVPYPEVTQKGSQQ